MTEKCIYCEAEITDDRPLTVCNRCGIRVWGEKMFNAILTNMKNAEETGTLCNCNLPELGKNNSRGIQA